MILENKTKIQYLYLLFHIIKYETPFFFKNINILFIPAPHNNIFPFSKQNNDSGIQWDNSSHR